MVHLHCLNSLIEVPRTAAFSGLHYVLPGTGAKAIVGMRSDGDEDEGEVHRGRELEMAGV